MKYGAGKYGQGKYGATVSPYTPDAAAADLVLTQETASVVTYTLDLLGDGAFQGTFGYGLFGLGYFGIGEE